MDEAEKFGLNNIFSFQLFALLFTYKIHYHALVFCAILQPKKMLYNDESSKGDELRNSTLWRGGTISRTVNGFKINRGKLKKGF